jgi:hypothetical protein
VYDLSNSSSPKFRSHYFNLTEAANSTCSNKSCPSKNAVAIGAGVGGGIGGSILIASAIFLLLFFLKRKKAEQQQVDPEMSTSDQICTKTTHVDPYVAPSPNPQNPVELPDRSPLPSELS